MVNNDYVLNIGEGFNSAIIATDYLWDYGCYLGVHCVQRYNGLYYAYYQDDETLSLTNEYYLSVAVWS